MEYIVLMENNGSSKKVIIHLCSEMSLRGGERQCIILHNGLLKNGWASYIVCRSGSELASQPIVHCLQFTCKNLFDIYGIHALYKICRSLASTLIHCHDSKSFTLAVMIKTMLPNVKIVYSRKVLFPIRPNTLNRLKFTRCAHVIAVSNAVASVCRIVAPRTPCTVIPDAATTDRLILSHDEARLRLGLSQNDICVGSVAYFTKEKNYECLVKCADHFSKVNHSIKFALIGPVEKGMENILKRNASIISTGYVHNAVSLYNAFDVYLSTSHSEGLGSALLDAIVRDIPSVALDAGGNRDLFGPFGSPAKSYPELLEQLSAIFADYSSVQTRAAAHGAWARTSFSIQNFMTKHCDLYSKLL